MSTTFTLTITAGDGENPITSNKTRTLRNLTNWFRDRLGGGLGNDTLVCGTAGTAASATATCAAVQANDTVTINGTAFTAAQKNARGTITPTVSGIDVDDTLVINATTLTAKRHNATGTVTFASAASGDDITVGATTFVATVGAVVLGEATYSVDTGNNEAATSFLAQVAGHAVASTVVTGTRSSAVVTLRSVATGVAGNSVVLTSVDGTTTAVSGAGTLANAVAVTAGTFDITGTDAQCCTSILAAIQASAALAAVVTASTTATVVTVRSILPGTVGNYVLTSSDAQLAVSGSGTMTGGAALANNAFDFGGTNTETAAALAASINATTTDAVNDWVTATSALGVVTVTALGFGLEGNTLTFVSSDGTRLAVTGSGRLGGGAETTTTFTF